jgi:Undecaprenyl-phosphate galactose phosphotransferase WbaP
MALSVVVADLISLSLAVVAGFFLWHLVNPSIPPLQRSMSLAVGFSMAAFAAYGMYPGIGKTAVEQMRLLCHGITLSYLLLLVSMFLEKELAYSRGGFLFAWVLSMLFVPLGRQLVGARRWWGVPVMIIGSGDAARKLILNLKASPAVGYKPVICIDECSLHAEDCLGVPVLGIGTDAAELAESYQTNLAIVALPGMDREQLVGQLRIWSRIFPNILIVPDLFGISSLWVEPRDLGGMLGFEIRHNLLNRWNCWIKRVIDIVLASAGLILAIPLYAAIALLIKRESPGPVIYTQLREGRGQKPIRVLKFRTMYPNAESLLESHLERDPAARVEWDRYCKLRNDPRVLRGVGSFLRKTSLDEVPQLWNILKGEMSLVGPRPFPSYHNQRFSSDFAILRTQVPPGLTGLWQISARSDGDLSVQEALDGYYIVNWSLWLDIYILIRTVWTVAARKGAY